MIETDKFHVYRVEREINQSRELGGSRMAAVSLGTVFGSTRVAKGVVRNGLPALEAV